VGDAVGDELHMLLNGHRHQRQALVGKDGDHDWPTSLVAAIANCATAVVLIIGCDALVGAAGPLAPTVLKKVAVPPGHAS
jgi:hypothetical protein